MIFLKYKLLKQYYDIRKEQGTPSNITMTDVVWSPYTLVGKEDSYVEDETYEDLTGEFVIESADGNPENDYRCANEDAKHAYGVTDLRKAFTVSSNVYYAYMGTRLSSGQLQKTAKDFMFNKTIDFDLPVKQSHFQKGKLTEAQRAISVIGQGQTEATPLHLALIAATIGNEGKMPKPYLVSSVKAGIFKIIISPLLLGVKPIFASYIPFSIAPIELLSNGLIQSCLASGIEIVASCFKGVSTP